MNAHQRAVVDFLRTVGAEKVRLARWRKHPRVIFEWRGRERFYVVPTTPGDTLRGAKNAISDLRRMLGLASATKRVGRRRSHKMRAASVKAKPPEYLSSLPDWRQSLLAQLTPTELEQVARAAWVDFWKSCMEQVGARSLL